MHRRDGGPAGRLKDAGGGRDALCNDKGAVRPVGQGEEAARDTAAGEKAFRAAGADKLQTVQRAVGVDQWDKERAPILAHFTGKMHAFAVKVRMRTHRLGSGHNPRPHLSRLRVPLRLG
ncbi:MAG: hypothetical protein AAB676_14485 [Verrucomicrobiota bacterium]